MESYPISPLESKSVNLSRLGPPSFEWLTKNIRILGNRFAFIAPWLRLAGLRWLIGYWIWIAVFRLIALTLLTYFMITGNHGVRFEELSDAFTSNELTFMGVGSALFVLACRWLPSQSILSPPQPLPALSKAAWLPGFTQGSILAGGIVLVFLLLGSHQYLGFFIQMDGAPIALLTLFVRTLALCSFAYFDEYIFRKQIEAPLIHELCQGEKRWIRQLQVTAGTALLYATVRWVQFDLGWMTFFTLLLLSSSLSLRAAHSKSFVQGAGFIAGILIFFQPICSLPVFGSDFMGLILMKYQSKTMETDYFTRLLTGGAGGPLSSLSLQVLLAIDLYRNFRLAKKSI